MNAPIESSTWPLYAVYPTLDELAAYAAQVLEGDPNLSLLLLLESIELRAPRLSAPAVLSALVTDDHESRIRHTYGRSYRDVLQGFRGDFAAAPDLVATPADEAEITALLDWAGDAKVAVIPFGGGTSVVGGVEGAREQLQGLGLEPGQAHYELMNSPVRRSSSSNSARLA